MILVEYKIHDIDFEENDALVTIGKETFYFQFAEGTTPTLATALEFIRNEVNFATEQRTKGII